VYIVRTKEFEMGRNLLRTNWKLKLLIHWGSQMLEANASITIGMVLC